MAYAKILRRIRDEKTNYNQRKRMLIGHRGFITVQLSNENTQVQIHQPELKGDKVISYVFDDNNFIISIDEIECVIKTNYDMEHINLVKINDLTITPYHPILPWYHTHKREWMFPSSIKTPELIHCNSLYTFVTKERNSIVIEGFAFATLGHNLQGNVISHDYLGTDQVINDLKKFTDYDTGLINLTPNMFKRNELGNIVEISSS